MKDRVQMLSSILVKDQRNYLYNYSTLILACGTEGRFSNASRTACTAGSREQNHVICAACLCGKRMIPQVSLVTTEIFA